MNFVGIDIGSTASKVSVRGDKEINYVLPTGWSSKETANTIKGKLLEEGIDVESQDTKVVATGYGRIAVDYADYVITEITCHARGGREFAGNDCAVIDVGGQDTKVIILEDGMVKDFLMNDKCSAGTGKFLEIMANRLGVTLQELFEMADQGTILPISSLCTVFAESEVINYIGEGKNREDIAAGVVDSVAAKVAQLAQRKDLPEKIILTGGLSKSRYFTTQLSAKLGKIRGAHRVWQICRSYRGCEAGGRKNAADSERLGTYTFAKNVYVPNRVCRCPQLYFPRVPFCKRCTSPVIIFPEVYDMVFGDFLTRVREHVPLVHNITNYVTVNDVANMILACGASPIMSDEPADVEEITALCQGLNINIGTLTKRTIDGMFAAGRKAKELGHATVLDPGGRRGQRSSYPDGSRADGGDRV